MNQLILSLSQDFSSNEMILITIEIYFKFMLII